METDTTCTAIVNSDLPSTAKRVLLRMGNSAEKKRNDIDTSPGTNTFSSDKENHLQNVIHSYHSDHSQNNNNNKNASSTPADMEQSRSVSLIQKLRQSAFRRKMNTDQNHSNHLIMTDIPNRSPSVVLHNNHSNSTKTAFSNSVTAIVDETQLSSPTSVRDRTTLLSFSTTTQTSSSPSPLPLSILKHRNHTHLSRSQHNQNENHTDLSPQTLVVGRLEDGMLNLRSPLIQTRITSDIDNENNVDNNNNSEEDDDDEQITVPQQETEHFDNPYYQSPDSLMISESSLEGDFDSHSGMITASSIISDTIPNNTTFDTATQITTTHIVTGVSSSSGVHSSSSTGTSMEFIQHLRGAAYRRKMNLTRSRDSLMNKEKQHRAHNAAIKLQREILERNQQEEQQQREDEQKRKLTQQQLQQTLLSTQWHDVPFKALPLPKSSQLHGGFIGIPKIDKRPPTIPISPHLGLRRRRHPQNHNRVGDHNKEGDEDEVGATRQTTNHSKASNGTISNEFKALPIPKSSLQLGGAGQSGIPKVSKRLITIPQSPLLGLRRPPKHHTAPKVSQTNVVSKSILRSDTTTVTNPMAIKAPTVHHMMTSSIQPYIPHSTRRAVQRAEFDQRRRHQEQVRIIHERHVQQQLVQRLQGELERLRIEI